MWPFTRTSAPLQSGILQGITDCHSHILPGVDDGIKTLEQALDVLRTYEEWGVREVWLTPHVMEDCPNRPADLRARFDELSAAYAAVAGAQSVTLHLGAENMLDSLFQKRLEADDFLPVLDGKHLLVETSYYNPPYGFDKLLSEIQDRGYTPILAHPERYLYMSATDYETLCACGVRLQLNLLSLCGTYGREPMHRSHQLLRRGLYSLVGSDLHHLEAFRRQFSLPVRRELLHFIEKIKTEN